MSSLSIAMTIDSLEAVKTLEKAGIPRNQAEAMAELYTKVASLPDVSQLATRADLDKLRTELRGETATGFANAAANLANAKVQLILAMIAVQGLFTSILFYLLKH